MQPACHCQSVFNKCCNCFEKAWKEQKQGLLVGLQFAAFLKKNSITGIPTELHHMNSPMIIQKIFKTAVLQSFKVSQEIFYVVLFI